MTGPNGFSPEPPQPRTPAGRVPRVLVTGAGGPAGVCFLRSLDKLCELFAADIDPNGAGLYLVGRDRRWLLPRGEDPDFAEALLRLCERLRIDVLVPTVDTELPPLARRVDDFTARGVRTLVPSASALEKCLDKWALAQACAGTVRVPGTVLLDAGTDTGTLAERLPAVAKPRHGSGSRGIVTVTRPDQLAPLPRDGTYLLQELLPGPEYSVDTLVAPDGTVVAAVPRSRDKTDSGIAVACHVLSSPELSALAAAVVTQLGLTGICNVQVREDQAGRPALLEVNPRPPGGLSLTIAAGVHMPAWSVAGALDIPLPEHIAHRELSAVRHWEDVIMPAGGLGDVAGRV